MISVFRNGDIHVTHNRQLSKTELLAVRDVIESFSYLLPDNGSLTLTGFADRLRKLYPVLENQASMLEDADFQNTYFVEITTPDQTIRRSIKALTASMAGDKIFRIYGKCKIKFTAMNKPERKDSFIIPKTQH